LDFRVPHQLVHGDVLLCQQPDEIGGALDGRDEFEAVRKPVQTLLMPWPEETSQHPVRGAIGIDRGSTVSR
jgi:hypothetical protein